MKKLEMRRRLGVQSSPPRMPKRKSWLKHQGSKKDDALIWDFDDVEEGDVLLRMSEAGIQTKKPGHIAVVYDTQVRGNIKDC